MSRMISASMSRAWFVVAILFSGPSGSSAEGERASPPEWPQFHGPKRDSKSEETGLLERWPAEGPRLLWMAKGIGEGYSSVSYAEGLVYTTGNIEAHTVITALDLNGGTRWTFKNGPAYKRSQPGTRSTPTITDGHLYHENADGDVVCLAAKTGKHVWSRNVVETFGGRIPQWGLAESLLVDGEKVICTPGGPKAGMVALDRRTGKTIWVSSTIDDEPGFCSPIAFEDGGVRQIATLMAKSVIGVSAETGILLWKVNHVTPYNENITSPIFHRGYILISTRSTGTKLLRLEGQGSSVSAAIAWETDKLDNQHEGLVLLDGSVYGSCLTRLNGPWVCMDFLTGEVKHAAPGIGRASLCYADGMFYLLNHEGKAALVRATPERFDLISSFDLPSLGRGPSWAHPVVCNGRLFLRHDDYLFCYSVKGP